uniref:Homeobox domain-containing protein n=2 Tax=Eptatretus burgeri TaxID=7764 RepID=A0A8C4NH39_EPTBU
MDVKLEDPSAGISWWTLKIPRCPSRRVGILPAVKMECGSPPSPPCSQPLHPPRPDSAQPPKAAAVPAPSSLPPSPPDARSPPHIPCTGAEAQVERDKRAVYRHPLFPLLALLFEKCEAATCGAETVTSASFDLDIENFVQRQEQEQRAFFSDEPEIDNLMVKAIQVLRIHLLELEKVAELCKDFCERYISCLRAKLHSEQLLRSDAPGSEETLLQVGTAVGMATLTTPQLLAGQLFQPVTMVTPQLVTSAVSLTPQTLPPPQPCVLSPPPLRVSPLPASQGPPTPPHSQEPGESDDRRGKLKRGVLPKQATNVMRSWLFQHIVHPYPTEDEKRQIASQTNLTLLQVNNWFINARRRILQPMLDSGVQQTEAAAPASRARKVRPPARPPATRFWPGALQTAPISSDDGSGVEVLSAEPSLEGVDSGDEDAESGPDEDEAEDHGVEGETGLDENH